MNYNNIFAFVRQQKAFTAFLTTLVVLGSFSAVFAARGVQAETVFTKVSDVLSKNAATVAASHTIKFTPLIPMTNSELDFVFAPEFNTSSLTFSDISVSQGAKNYDIGANCTGKEIGFSAPTNQTVRLQICPATTIASSTEVKFIIGGAVKMINPAAASYEILIKNAASQQSQKIRVAILPKDTLMTAKVDPIFTFSVASTAATTSVNGAVTTFPTQDSVIDFGTLVPNVASIGAQKLTVSTNAINGFTVTSQTDSEFKSANGATIDPFNVQNAAGVTSSSSAQVWSTLVAANPTDDKTWGQIGMTSDGVTTFSANKWVGNFINNPVLVMSAASSSRAATATVGYQAQITDLQEAATDYKTNVIYVATPQF